ncbi:YutD family protein [Facklamia sp. 7083-14-GEN3]|uniref:YutD family protein n=1 Tax=Facklamia sp. 7083-14-GEN3 TaxID=2973478 RepID=UPI00215B9D35|nr:YutD family protein [Facklamia sp. 7083-14-GEN3]MCR8969238.1 YutD family protein [Facklamia sp. 7083-14-GEN3]
MKDSSKEIKINKQLDQLLDDLTSNEANEEIIKNIKLFNENSLMIEDEEYDLIINYQEAFDFEAFYNRYQDLFAKYDFIVGDWAFDQLRLRGFYQIGTPKVAFDQRIETLEDYINEYCNFGAKYFVIGKKSSIAEYPHLLDRLRAGKLNNIQSKTLYPRTSNKNKRGRNYQKRTNRKIQSLGHRSKTVTPKIKRRNEKNSSQVKAKNKNNSNGGSNNMHKPANKIKHKKDFVIKKRSN